MRGGGGQAGTWGPGALGKHPVATLGQEDLSLWLAAPLQTLLPATGFVPRVPCAPARSALASFPTLSRIRGGSEVRAVAKGKPQMFLSPGLWPSHPSFSSLAPLYSPLPSSFPSSRSVLSFSESPFCFLSTSCLPYFLSLSFSSPFLPMAFSLQSLSCSLSLIFLISLTPSSPHLMPTAPGLLFPPSRCLRG